MSPLNMSCISEYYGFVLNMHRIECIATNILKTLALTLLKWSLWVRFKLKSEYMVWYNHVQNCREV